MLLTKDGRRPWANGKDAQRFLLEKQVMHMVERGMGELLEKRPEDPCGWLAGYIKAENVLRTHKTVQTELNGLPVTLTSTEQPHATPGDAPPPPPVPGVHKFRSCGGDNVFGCVLPKLDGFEALLHHLSRDRGLKRVIVVNVTQGDVAYRKGVANAVVGYPKNQETSFAEALAAANGAHHLYSLEKVVQEAAARARVTCECMAIPLANSTVPPALGVYDRVVGIVDADRKGFVDNQTTAVVVASLEGAEDVAVGMSIFATVVRTMAGVRTNATKKAAWLEQRRDELVRKRANDAAIEALHRKGVEADEDYFAKHERHALSAPVPEADGERERRLAMYDHIRKARQQQLDKYLHLLLAEASTKIGKVARGHLARKSKRVPPARLPTQSPSVAPQSAPPTDVSNGRNTPPPKSRRTKAKIPRPVPLNACCMTAEQLYNASLDEVTSLTVVERCIRFLEQRFSGDLFTRSTTARQLRQVTKQEVLPNSKKLVADKKTITHHAYDIHLDRDELFVVVERQAEEERGPMDFAIRWKEYFTVLRACMHGRCLITDLARAKRKHVGVYAVQKRILRSIELLVHGIALGAWVAVRECTRGSPGTLSVFSVAGADALPETFSAWLRGCDMYQDLQHPHLMMLSLMFDPAFSRTASATDKKLYIQPPQIASTLTDRVLVRVGPAIGEGDDAAGSPPITPPPRGASGTDSAVQLQASMGDVSASVVTGGVDDAAGGGDGKPTVPTRQRSLSFMGKNAANRVHCFRRYHRRVPVFTVSPPLQRDDLCALFRGYSRERQRVLWLSLTPAFTAFVRCAGFMHAPLATPAHQEDALTVARMSTCRFVEVKDRSGSLRQKVSRQEKNKRPKSNRRGGPAGAEFRASEFADADADVDVDASDEDDAAAAAEVPLYTHAWSQLEARFTEELKMQMTREQSVAFVEWVDQLAGSAGGERSRVLKTARMPYAPQTPLTLPTKSRSVQQGVKQGSMSSTATNGILSGDGAGSVRVGYAGTGSTTPAPAPVPPEPVVSEAAALKAIAEAWRCENLAYHRQPALFGVGGATMWRVLDGITREVEAALAVVHAADGRATDTAVVVWHEDEGTGTAANPMFMMVATAAYALLTKKIFGEDQVELLTRARRASEGMQKRASTLSKMSRFSRRSGGSKSDDAGDARSSALDRSDGGEEESEEEDYEEEESEEEDELSEDHRTDVSAARDDTGGSSHAGDGAGGGFGVSQSQDAFTHMATAGDTATTKPLFSPIPIIDSLISSDLGCDMELIEAIQYLDMLCDSGPRATEEVFVGRMTDAMAAADAAIAEGRNDETVARHAREAVCLLECYLTVLFYVAWLTAHIRPEPQPQQKDTAPPTYPPSQHPSFASSTSAPLPPPDKPAPAPMPPYRGSFTDFMTEGFPEAAVFLADINPWKDAPRVDPAWVAPVCRWRRTTLIHEVQ